MRAPPAVVQLERASAELDALIGDLRCGAGRRSHREYERTVARAEAIAAGIRAAFRGQPKDER